MDDDLRNALVDLKASVDRQVKIQEETNQLMRVLIQSLAENSQELLDSRKARDDR